jgi:YihY family inner membrane protein
VRRNLAAQRKLNWRWIIVRILDDSFARARRFDIASDSRALSFTFILSLVPLLAIAFTFFKLFGGLQYFIESTLKPFLDKNFPSGVASQLNGLIDGFVGNLQTGTLGVVSFVTLLATVVALMMNIEQSFNRIFEARDHRSMFKRIGSYWIMLSATPLFIALSTAKSSELISAFRTNAGVLNEYGIVDFLRTSAGHIFQMTGFGAMFMILPELGSNHNASYFPVPCGHKCSICNIRLFEPHQCAALWQPSSSRARLSHMGTSRMAGHPLRVMHLRICRSLSR